MSELLGSNLIFLISQPRAGSTLLQRILGSHPAVHTASEPWLMLYPFYALRHEGYQAEYAARWAWQALHSFLAILPGGEDDYYQGVRAMYSYLYQRALEDSGKQCFLDKTPRYYLIIPELFRTFPEARYIFLLRNPLAVLNSILNTWASGNRLKLHNFKCDLVRAPRLLMMGLDHVGERGIAVHYEQFVAQPESELRRICGALGLDFVPDVLEYGRSTLPHWRYGDQEMLYQHRHPVPEIAEKWMGALDNPQTWRLLRDYLELLGQYTIQQMGYQYAELESMLAGHRPRPVGRWLTVSLEWLLKEPPESRSPSTKALMRLVGSVRRRAASHTASGIEQSAGSALSDPD